MPLYEYERPDGTTFEVFQAISDQPLTHDPQSGVPVKKVLHAPAVHFKGSGFYNTDYGTRRRERERAKASDKDGGKGKDGEGGTKGGGAKEPALT